MLTNVKQLELLLTRQRDVELFSDARLDFLVFDEAHTFTGTNGVETACLIRRLRKFCGKDASQTTGIATSATIVDETDPDAAWSFASRFLGVPAEDVVTVHEEYQEDNWSPSYNPPAPSAEPADLLAKALAAVDDEEPESAIRSPYQRPSQHLPRQGVHQGDTDYGVGDPTLKSHRKSLGHYSMV